MAIRSSRSTARGCSPSATSTSIGRRPGLRVRDSTASSMIRCRDSGPRRSNSVDHYLRGTCLVALVGGVLSDALQDTFWIDHPLLAGLVASLIVVMLTVALVNEALERRS